MWVYLWDLVDPFVMIIGFKNGCRDSGKMIESVYLER